MVSGEEIMKKIVIFNCPKRSGKDTTAQFLLNMGVPASVKAFKDKLIEIALCTSLISKNEWNLRYDNYKDVPWDKLNGLTQREYLIKISEDWVKPTHGSDYFGKALCNSILYDYENLADLIIITDGGFNSETEAVVKEFGENNVLILQWTRNNTDWSGDSRGWVTSFPNRTVIVDDNDGCFKQHCNNVLQVLIDNRFTKEL